MLEGKSYGYIKILLQYKRKKIGFYGKSDEEVSKEK
jgi:hypothetical protein